MLNDLLKDIAAEAPLHYIQFGGNDGVLADPLWPFLRDGGGADVASGHVFEPNPVYFERLERNLSAFAQITCHNHAIGSIEGPETQVLHYIHPDDVRDHKLPRWTMGLCSFYDDKNALGGVGSKQAAALHETIKPFIRQIEVTCLTLDRAMTLRNGPPCDVLLSDTEGHDWEILKQWDMERFGRPKLIHAEIICLTPEETQALLSWLSSHGYSAEVQGQNVTAQRLN